MSRKTRKSNLNEKRQRREENNYRKKKYHEMGLKGILGDKEIKKYALMYEALNGQRDLFPSPNENPKRQDYTKIKMAYNSLDSKL